MILFSPVKNGWQLPQMSTRMDLSVEPALYTAPQAQLISGSGWYSQTSMLALVRFLILTDIVVTFINTIRACDCNRDFWGCQSFLPGGRLGGRF